MKKLHKKIGAMALAGMIVAAGGCIAGGGKVFADNPSRYAEDNYESVLPYDEKYSSLEQEYDLLNNDDSEEAKKQIRDIENAVGRVGGKKVYAIKLSSEVGEDVGINGFVGGIKDILSKLPGGSNLFHSILHFKNAEQFELYLKANMKHIDSGFYRAQVGGIEGIFRVGNGKLQK